MTNELAQLLREAAEYLEYAHEIDLMESGRWNQLSEQCLQAAASLEAQEPVAWMRGFVTYAGVDGRTDGERICSERKVYDDDLPLYRHPPTSAVPDGWKLVPVEPDYNMIKAADEKLTGKSGVLSIADAYRAMLAAAPQQGGSKDE